MEHENLVHYITAEVLRQFKQQEFPREPVLPACKIVAIFTGGTIGLEQAIRELRCIQDSKAEITVVLSRAAEEIVGSKRIQDELGSGVTIVNSHCPYPGKKLREADVVLVPILTQNTAAKLAATLSDTLPTTLIMQALMMGKPVIAAPNAADPQDGWRLDKMGKTGPALTQALQANLRKLENYGIRLVPVQELAGALKTILGREIRQTEPQPLQQPVKKGVLDASAIKTAADSGEKKLFVAKGTIVTPLARDTAREHAIELVYQS